MRAPALELSQIFNYSFLITSLPPPCMYRTECSECGHMIYLGYTDDFLYAALNKDLNLHHLKSCFSEVIKAVSPSFKGCSESFH